MTSIKSAQSCNIHYTNSAHYFSDIKVSDSFAMSGADVLVLDRGKVLISYNLLKTIAEARFLQPVATLGRKAFYLVDDDLIKDAEDQANYPRRSAREQAVANRNKFIINHLLELATA